MQYVVDIAVNLLANLIGWCLVIVIGYYAVTIRARRRRRLMRFLGLSRERTRLTTYLSSLDLSIQVKNLYNQQQRWSGLALSAAEFEIIPTVDRWLHPITEASDVFLDTLFNYLTPVSLRLPKINPQYLPSPRTVDELQLHDQTLIVIGGTAHNAFAKAYSDKNMIAMETDDPERGVRVTKGKNSERIFRPTSPRQDDGSYQTEVAKLEKICDPERRTVAIIAEGVGTNGTLAAVHYLVTNWEQLWREHGENPFAICVECPTRSLNSAGYLNPSVIVTLSNEDL